MRFTVNSQVLAAEVRLLNRIVPSKSSIPVLSNIRFEALDDSISLAATDLQVAMVTSCRATVTEPGVVTLPARKLTELLEQIPNADIEITLEKSHVRIACGSFKSRMQTLSALEFPAVPTPEGIVSELPAGSLKSLIDRTTYAISDKSAQYVLKGALLTLNNDVFAMVSTDGLRLSIATANCAMAPLTSVIVPIKTLESLASHCEGKIVEFSHTDKHLFFIAGKRTLISRMMDGQFPKYERIIPRDCERRLTVDRVSFAAALRRVGFAADDGKAVLFHLNPGTLQIASSSVEVGDADEQLTVTYDGPEMHWKLNGGFVLDFLDKASQPSVTIDIKNERAPFLFTDGPDFVNVIMGMS